MCGGGSHLINGYSFKVFLAQFAKETQNDVIDTSLAMSNGKLHFAQQNGYGCAYLDFVLVFAARLSHPLSSWFV